LKKKTTEVNTFVNQGVKKKQAFEKGLKKGEKSGMRMLWLDIDERNSK
jgi:hypothetical protein